MIFSDVITLISSGNNRKAYCLFLENITSDRRQFDENEIREILVLFLLVLIVLASFNCSYPFFYLIYYFLGSL